MQIKYYKQIKYYNKILVNKEQCFMTWITFNPKWKTSPKIPKIFFSHFSIDK